VPLGWLRDVPDLWRREPMLTGRVGGALYIGAGLYALLLLVLPGTTLTHPELVAPLGVASVVYGLLSTFVLDWQQSGSKLSGTMSTRLLFICSPPLR